VIRASWWNPRLGPWGFCALVLVAHAVFLEVLARFDVVSCIFAAGNHVPLWMLACAVFFALIRLMAFLLVPAILAWRLAAAVLRRVRRAL
jgi:hypothetical protein